MIGIMGSNGILGSILKKKLASLNIKFSEFKGDILNEESVNLWIKSNDFISLFHFAAMVPVNNVEKNKHKAFKVNVLGTQNIINALITFGKNPWLFYASTSHVYNYSKDPLSEIHKPNPINYYGYTKFLGEEVLSFYKKKINPSVCIGRIFSFYHPSQKIPFLYPSIKEKLKKIKRNTLEIYGSKNIRDISTAEEIIEIIYKLFLRKYKGTVNIGSGKGMSIEQFVKLISRQNNLIIKDIEKYKPNMHVANINKLKKIINVT